MGIVFHPSTNTIAKASIFGFVFIVAAIVLILAVLVRSPYVTGVNNPVEQPVPFSHEHHVSGLGIDCRYCHTSVEDSAFAGIPPTETCMTCHSQIWPDAAMLAPVRESYETGVPLEWNRVHDLPDFVYFNHAMHVQKGIGCESCHGDVPEMPLIWQEKSLQMQWCLDCHRDPENFIRPREEVFTFDWEPPVPQEVLGAELIEEYHVEVERLTDCSVCHR